MDRLRSKIKDTLINYTEECIDDVLCNCHELTNCISSRFKNILLNYLKKTQISYYKIHERTTGLLDMSRFQFRRS